MDTYEYSMLRWGEFLATEPRARHAYRPDGRDRPGAGGRR